MPFSAGMFTGIYSSLMFTVTHAGRLQAQISADAIRRAGEKIAADRAW